MSARILLNAVFYTFAESILSTALAVAVGLPCAYFLANKNFPGKKILSSLSAIPLCVPPLIVALGYVSVFGVSGFFSRAFEKIFSVKTAPQTFLYSFWGIIVVQGFYNFPLVMTTVANSWSALDPIHEQCARLLGAGERRIFWTITFAKILPAIISAAIPIFVFCFFSFVLVLIFAGVGRTTLEVLIFHAAKSARDFSLCARLSFLETFCALLFLFFYAAAENKSEKTKGLVLKNKKENFSKSNFSHFEFFLFAILLFLIFCFFVLPFFSILISSFLEKKGGKEFFSFLNWKKFFLSKNFLFALKNTIVAGALTSVFCAIVGSAYSVFLKIFSEKKSPLVLRAFLKTIPLFPLAISSVATGIFFAAVSKRANFLTLVFAQTSLFWPFAFRQIFPFVQKIPKEVLQSASLLSKNFAQKIFFVMIPYAKKGVLSAAGFCFAMSAGDAALPLVLALPHYENLSLLVYRLVGAYKFSQASCAGFFLAALCVFFVRVFQSKAR